MSVLLSSLVGSVAILQIVQAGTPVFTYTNLDVLVTFRKIAANGVGTISPNDLEIDIGQVSTFSAAAGTRIPVSQFTTSQIAASFDSLDDLSWSAAACVPATDSGASAPVKSLWLTAPRPTPAIPATPWVRRSSSSQGATAADITSVLANASFYSSTIPADGTNNSANEVAVPAGSGFEAGAFLSTLGNYKNTFQGDVENTTPDTFDTDGLPSRSDFYQLNPDSTGTGPSGTYLGYFELETSGAMVFVAGTAPLTPPTLTTGLSGNVATISFPTVAGSTYTLYYTNSAGLTAPILTWPSVSTNIIGNGSVQAFQQTAASANQFYTIVAH